MLLSKRSRPFFILECRLCEINVTDENLSNSLILQPSFFSVVRFSVFRRRFIYDFMNVLLCKFVFHFERNNIQKSSCMGILCQRRLLYFIHDCHIRRRTKICSIKVSFSCPLLSHCYLMVMALLESEVLKSLFTNFDRKLAKFM